MQARNPTDDELWRVCRELPSDFEPYGQRKWPGPREARPDCSACCWFVELFRTWPDWGTCANPESPRVGLLTNWEQGCWKWEQEEECFRQATRSARCDFMRGFEWFLREQAGVFMRTEVQKANDPLREEEPPPVPIRRNPLFVVVRRLLKHADEGFRRQAFDSMAARARRDTRRCWEFARWFLARSTGEDISGIRLPENMRELEDRFWKHVGDTIGKALEGRGCRPSRATKKKRKKAG